MQICFLHQYKTSTVACCVTAQQFHLHKCCSHTWKHGNVLLIYDSFNIRLVGNCPYLQYRVIQSCTQHSSFSLLTGQYGAAGSFRLIVGKYPLHRAPFFVFIFYFYIILSVRIYYSSRQKIKWMCCEMSCTWNKLDL